MRTIHLLASNSPRIPGWRQTLGIWCTSLLPTAQPWRCLTYGSRFSWYYPLKPTVEQKTFYIIVYAEWGYLPTRRHWYVRRAVRACSGPPPHKTGCLGKASGSFHFCEFCFPFCFAQIKKTAIFLYYFCRSFCVFLWCNDIDILYETLFTVILLNILIKGFGIAFVTLGDNFQVSWHYFKYFQYLQTDYIQMVANNSQGAYITHARCVSFLCTMHCTTTCCGLSCGSAMT